MDVKVAFAQAIPNQFERDLLRSKYGQQKIEADFHAAMSLEDDPIPAFTRTLRNALSQLKVYPFVLVVRLSGSVNDHSTHVSLKL